MIRVRGIKNIPLNNPDNEFLYIPPDLIDGNYSTPGDNDSLNCLSYNNVYINICIVLITK